MNRPLVVDLDGTLLRSDLLVEAMLSYLRQDAAAVLKMPLWLAGGKAALKERLAGQVQIDVSVLPFNEELVSLLRQARLEGRHIVLATASHRLYAGKVAAYLDLFDQVMATDGKENLSSRHKRDRLVAEFGEKGFDYVGNSRDDLPVWMAAERAWLVDPEPGVEGRARKIGNVEKVIVSPHSALKSWVRSLRPHQWMKNMLMFIPLLAAHQVSAPGRLLQVLLAFVFFSMCASSGYLFNDLLDLESDRYHGKKRHRPLASGDLSIKIGIVSAPLLFLVAFVGSMLLMPKLFTVVLVMYYVTSMAYSQWLKRLKGVDTIVLAGLYTVRIIAGSYACALVPTFWILAFSMFLFLSLAMVKRYAELYDAHAKGKTDQARGRGYYPSDLPIIANLGTVAGYLSVLVLALYIQDARTVEMYRTHELIWFACPILLFWISRVWIITHRGEMHEDPVLFAIRDRVSLLTGGMFAAVFVLALMI